MEEIKTEELPTPQYYVGQDKVQAISVTDNVDLVGVMYESGRHEDFTTEQWENVKSEAPYGPGEVSTRKHEALMVRILKLMVKSRVTLGEQSWILERVNESIGSNYTKSISKLYNVTNPEKIFLYDIDQVLKSEVSEDTVII